MGHMPGTSWQRPRATRSWRARAALRSWAFARGTRPPRATRVPRVAPCRSMPRWVPSCRSVPPRFHFDHGVVDSVLVHDGEVRIRIKGFGTQNPASSPRAISEQLHRKNWIEARLPGDCAEAMKVPNLGRVCHLVQVDLAWF